MLLEIDYQTEILLLEITIIIARSFIELLFFAIGACIFSFLNVIIYRLPRKMQFTMGSSMCTSCHHKLMAKDLVPIVSWCSLKGKCRYCGEKISVRYTIVEVLGGVAAVVWTLTLGINLWAVLAFIATGIVLTGAYILYDKVREKNADKKAV